MNFLPKKDFLRFRTPSARRSITACSHGAFRYQRAAGEACNLSMQLQKRRFGCLTPVKVKKAKSEERERERERERKKLKL